MTSAIDYLKYLMYFLNLVLFLLDVSPLGYYYVITYSSAFVIDQIKFLTK